MRSKVKYLGTWLGHATILDQYQRPLAKLMGKAQFLASLPLKAEEKVQALHTWAYLVLRHIAVLFFPTHQIIRKANLAMRVALGIRSWALPTTHCYLTIGGVCVRISGRHSAGATLRLMSEPQRGGGGALKKGLK